MNDVVIVRSIPEALIGPLFLLQQQLNPLPWSERTIQAAVMRNQVLVALDDQSPVGFLFFSSSGDEIEILDIGVAREHQQQGIGQRLLQWLISEEDPPALFLEVRISNEAAIALYTAAGFVRVGIRSRFYGDTGEDALIMKRVKKELDKEEYR